MDLKISYPREGASFPFLKQSFVLGAVRPSTASVSINGSTVSVHRTGSFAALIPYATGAFEIRAGARMGEYSNETVRTIFVSGPPIPLSTAALVIAEESVLPDQDFKFFPGETFKVHMKATPHAGGFYRLSSARIKKTWEPMTGYLKSAIWEN